MHINDSPASLHTGERWIFHNGFNDAPEKILFGQKIRIKNQEVFSFRQRKHGVEVAGFVAAIASASAYFNTWVLFGKRINRSRDLLLIAIISEDDL